MRKLISATIIGFALLSGPASAQYYSSPYSDPYATQQPQSGTTYDRQTGNRYSWQRDSQGNTTVRGSNIYSGSTWRTQIEPDGDQRGTDASGNSWRYNAQTGSYYNSDGTYCYGRTYRTCN